MDEDAQRLLDSLQSQDADIRYRAWQSAGPAGPAAVRGLTTLMCSPDKGVVYSSRGALETLVHYSAAPGRSKTARAVADTIAITSAQKELPPAVRGQLLHLLGYIGDGRQVGRVAPLLADPAVQDEARLCIERIPGSAATHALEMAARKATAEFKPHIQQSLRARARRPAELGLE